MPFDVELDDGTVIQDVPDGTTKAQIAAKYQAHLNSSKPSMSAGDVLKGAVTNLPESALNLGKNIVSPLIHPLDTAKNVGNLVGGVAQHIIPSLPQNQAANDAYSNAGNYLQNRYGGVENLKQTLATDPAGLLADASVLAGGAGLAAKAGGLSKAASLADKLGEVSNPIALAGKAVSPVASGLGKLLSEGLGVTTGAGGQSIRAAFDAGKAGGSAADAFQNNLRGNVPIESIVDTAKAGISNLERKRGADYRAGMGTVNSDPTVLSLSPIDQAINQSNSINNFKGVDLSPSTAKVRQDIADTIDTWRNGNPQDFHTAAGFDALKKAVGNIRDTTQYGSPERVIADKAYNAIKSEVANQAPDYANTMKGYAQASDRIDELRKTFSLGEGVQKDTSIRKLQSALRDNVNTSFGRRTDLATELANNGAPNLLESIAGQTLSSVAPRGLGKMLASGEAGGAVTTALLGHPGAAAAILPALAMQSPRAVGEASYYAGKASGLGKAINGKSAARAALLADELGAQTGQKPTPAMLGQLLMRQN